MAEYEETFTTRRAPFGPELSAATPRALSPTNHGSRIIR